MASDRVSQSSKNTKSDDQLNHVMTGTLVWMLFYGMTRKRPPSTILSPASCLYYSENPTSSFQARNALRNWRHFSTFFSGQRHARFDHHTLQWMRKGGHWLRVDNYFSIWNPPNKWKIQIYKKTPIDRNSLQINGESEVGIVRETEMHYLLLVSRCQCYFGNEMLLLKFKRLKSLVCQFM